MSSSESVVKSSPSLSSTVSLARAVLAAPTDRDALGLVSVGPLEENAIRECFRQRVMCLHPDKTPLDTAVSSAEGDDQGQLCAAALTRLIEARDRLVDLCATMRSKTTGFEWQSSLNTRRCQPIRGDAMNIVSPASVLVGTILLGGSASRSSYMKTSGGTCGGNSHLVEYPCVHPMCGGRVDVLGAECASCSRGNIHLACGEKLSRGSGYTFDGFMTNDAGQRTVCATLGCLQLLATTEELKRGTCVACSCRPHKCAYFGCLIQTNNGSFCPRHSDGGVALR